MSWPGSCEREEVQPGSVARHHGRYERTGREGDRRGIGTPGRMVREGSGDEPESIKGRIGRMGRMGGVVMFVLTVALCPTPLHARHTTRLRSATARLAVAPRAEAAGTGEVNLTATSANVKESGSPVRIHILRWSTDEERNPVVAA